MSNQFGLLKERRFAPFFGVQFLGALNDNVFKQALVILLTYSTARYTTMSTDILQNLAQALFVLPFFLFSATAGQFADKYEKSRLISITVAIEFACMALGAAGFFLHSLPLLFAALFLGGIQSALFGPVKYAILPQHLKESELVGGNGMVEMGTSVAILVGMMLGGWLVAQEGWGVTAAAFVTMGISATGFLLSRLIPLAPAAAPELKINWNPLTETWRNFQFMRGNRTVFLSVLGISWFWFYGSIFITQFPNLSKDILSGQESVVTLLLIVFSIGIGVGSLLCERLSGHKVEIGLVPFGSIGMTLFGIDLYFALAAHLQHEPMTLAAFIQDAGHWRILGDLFLIGLFGGFYIVPLYALIQIRSEPSHRSRIIAGNNILNPYCGRAVISSSTRQVSIPALLVTGCERRCVHLPAGAGVPDALHRLAADPLGVPPEEGRAGAHPRGRRGGDRLQPRQLRRRADHRGGLPAADPLRDGPPDLQTAHHQFRFPRRARHSHRTGQEARNCCGRP
jgi:MFS family permease